MWFDNEMGWGFVQMGDGNSNVFVDRTSFRGRGFTSLYSGERVWFYTVKRRGGKGLKAMELTK